MPSPIGGKAWWQAMDSISRREITDASILTAITRAKSNGGVPDYEVRQFSGGTEYDGGKYEEACSMMLADGWKRYGDWWVWYDDDASGAGTPHHPANPQ